MSKPIASLALHLEYARMGYPDHKVVICEFSECDNGATRFTMDEPSIYVCLEHEETQQWEGQDDKLGIYACSEECKICND